MSSIANDDVGYCFGTLSSWERPRCHSFVSGVLLRDLRLLFAVYIVRFTTDTLKCPQFFPPRIGRCLVRMIRLAVQVDTALDTETETLLATQWLERQVEHDVVPKQRLKVEEVAL